MSDKAVKFKVMRMGDPSDAPPGKWGCVLVGEAGEHNTALTLQCDTDHEHGKECAQALLDAKILGDGEAKQSPREVITKILDDRRAAKAAEKAVKCKPCPKKEVEVVEDGKKVKRMVEDRDLA